MGETDSRISKIDELAKHASKIVQSQTLEKLGTPLSEKTDYSEKEVPDYVLSLRNQGKLNFDEKTLGQVVKLKTHFLSSRSYWYWCVIALSLVTITIVFAISEGLFPFSYIRYLIGAIFVLGLPGYVFVKLLYPNRALPRIEIIAISLVMSLIIVSITAFLLGYTPWGLGTASITLSLFGFIVLIATAAFFREY